MKRIAIIGASGAIGSAFLDYFCDHPDTEQVYACSRKPVTHNSPLVTSLHTDLRDETTLRDAAQSIEHPLDCIIIASGLLHNNSIGPEKNLQQLDMQQMLNVFTVNSIGPALVMKHFMPRLATKSRAVMAALSARVGSINDNRLGGWYSYRASKAALNMQAAAVLPMMVLKSLREN